MGSEVRLTPNRRKIVEAVLFLIEEAAKAGDQLSQYEIVKALFQADTQHLNTYGRPVTFDNYVAMENGPVASEAYEMLKATYNWGALGLDACPWSARSTGPKTNAYSSRRAANLRLLSPSDQDVLREGLEFVRTNGFGGVRDATHEHRAWKRAWEDRGAKRANPMDYTLLYDNPDPEAVEDLAYVSAHVA